MDNGWVPTCPVAGHDRHRVVRDGWKGAAPRRRQRWRCIAPDGSFHRVPVAKVARLEALTQACLDCENELHHSQGHRVAAKYDFVAREVAAALVALANGATYADASKAVRSSVGRLLRQAGRPLPWSETGMTHGQLAATWVETYSDVVLGDDEEQAWPEVVLLDATDFWRWNGAGMKVRAFYVLCAYGYDVLPAPEPEPEPVQDAPRPAWPYELLEAAGVDPFWTHFTPVEEQFLAWLAAQTGIRPLRAAATPPPRRPRPQQVRGRLLRAWAAKTNSENDWAEMLRSLPGTPRYVVCDAEGSIASAAGRVWGTKEGSLNSELVRCIWHLRKNLGDALALDLSRAGLQRTRIGDKHRTHPLYDLIKDGTATPHGWHVLRDTAYQHLGHLWFGEREVRLSPSEARARGRKTELVPYDSATLTWLRHNELRVLLLQARQPDRPGPASTGPLEAVIVKLRAMLSGRAQTLHNRERTQLLLRLIVAGQRGDADVNVWAERVRNYLASLDSAPPKQRPLALSGGAKTL